MTKLAILAAAAVEGLLLVIGLLRVNWSDSTHVLLFIFAVLGYTIVALGLVALGAHVSRAWAHVWWRRSTVTLSLRKTWVSERNRAVKQG